MPLDKEDFSLWKPLRGINLMESVVGKLECGLPVFYFARAKLAWDLEEAI